MPFNLGNLWNKQNATPPTYGPITSPYMDRHPGGRTIAPGFPGFPPVQETGHTQTVARVSRPRRIIAGRGTPRRATGGVVVGNGYARSLARGQSLPGISARNAGQIASSSPGVALRGWSYSYQAPNQRIGPVPKLSYGSGRTGPVENRGTGQYPIAGANFLGYASNTTGSGERLTLSQFDINPPHQEDYTLKIPRSIGYGDDGFYAIQPTYRAHDFTPAQRFHNANRSAPAWQDTSFGPVYRQLLPQQQVARYNLYNQVAVAQSLSKNSYFLGYSTDPQAAAQTGSSSIRPLGN